MVPLEDAVDDKALGEGKTHADKQPEGDHEEEIDMNKGCDGKSLEEYEKAALESLKSRPAPQVGKSSVKMKRPAASKAPKKKAAPNGQQARKATPHSSVQRKKVGCTRCRGNPKGCKVCLKDGFRGKVFGCHDEWKKWHQHHVAKNH